MPPARPTRLFVDSSAVTSPGDVGFRSPPVWEPDPRRSAAPLNSGQGMRAAPAGRGHEAGAPPGHPPGPLAGKGQIPPDQRVTGCRHRWTASSKAVRCSSRLKCKGFFMLSAPQKKRVLKGFASSWGARRRNSAGNCEGNPREGFAGRQQRGFLGLLPNRKCCACSGTESCRTCKA